MFCVNFVTLVLKMLLKIIKSQLLHKKMRFENT